MLNVSYRIGDATVPTTDRCLIAHICNNLGGWGRGFVLPLAKRFPETEAYYRTWHKDGDLCDQPFELGSVQFVDVGTLFDAHFVANMIAQDGYSKPGKPACRKDALAICFRQAVDFALERNLVIQCPRMGSGLGGLPWEHVLEALQVGFELTARWEDEIDLIVYDLEAVGGTEYV